MHVQVESFFILGVDFYFNIGYNGNMSNEQKERKMKPQTKKILKEIGKEIQYHLKNYAK